MFRCRASILTRLAIITLLMVGWGVLASVSAAAPSIQDATPTPGPSTQPIPGAYDENLSISDNVCLGCHGQPGVTMPLADGSELELYVPAEAHAASVHGKMGYACVQCHRDVGNYPHPPFTSEDARDASLKLYTACKYCHVHQYELALDSVHGYALAVGNREAAICTDCHTAHDVRRLHDPETGEQLPDARIWIPQTCARCHSAIYEKYRESVHGTALTEGNPDVPTCIDCHGVHNIEDPTTNYFRLKSPEMCAKCHTDPNIMGKYGISTEVLETYVSDFHGTSLVLFEPRSPDAPFNEPVCYDCHGVHDIVRANNPEKGLHVRKNLLVRCQGCHPDATSNFPDAWLSHYIPSPEFNPLVYYVNLFYTIFIPGMLGGMALLVFMDFSRMGLNRYRGWRRKRVDTAMLEEHDLEMVEESPPAKAQDEPAAQSKAKDPDSETEEHG